MAESTSQRGAQRAQRPSSGSSRANSTNRASSGNAKQTVSKTDTKSSEQEGRDTRTGSSVATPESDTATNAVAKSAAPAPETEVSSSGSALEVRTPDIVDSIVSEQVTHAAVKNSSGKTHSPILHAVNVIEDLRAEKESAEGDSESAGMIRHFIYLLMGGAIPAIALSAISIPLIATSPTIARLLLIFGMVISALWVICFGVPAVRSVGRVERRTEYAEEMISRSLDTSVSKFEQMVLDAEEGISGRSTQ